MSIAALRNSGVVIVGRPATRPIKTAARYRSSYLIGEPPRLWPVWVVVSTVWAALMLFGLPYPVEWGWQLAWRLPLACPPLTLPTLTLALTVRVLAGCCRP